MFFLILIADAIGYFLFLKKESVFMKSPVFTGAATALITPFDESGIDYNALARLIDWQIESGINALVVCERPANPRPSPTQSTKGAIEFTVKQVNGRFP